MNDFATPPNHIKFLAKRLFGNCGRIIDGAIAYLEPGGGGPETDHTHAHDHLFIVVSGQATIRLGGERKTLNPNEAFLVKGGIPHSVWNSDAQTTVMVGISVEAEERKNA